MLPLTVLKNSPSSSPEQLVRLFHQSQLEWARHMGEETELDFGRWIPAANCLLDAFLPKIKACDVMAEMEERSRQGGSEWNCCSLNPSLPGEQTAPLAEALLAAGWVARPLNILHRNQRKPGARCDTADDLKIIPARASYRHYRQLMDDRALTDVDAAVLHLDDSHLDVLLALKEGDAVGSIGVLTSGEVGTVREWYVTPGERHQGVGGQLLDRALEIALRGMLKHLMIGLPDSTSSASRICRSAGFEIIGKWPSFWKDSCKCSELFA